MNLYTRYQWLWLAAAFALVAAIYWPGLSGPFLFDDYPNIVDNHALQPTDTSVGSLVRAALSSPSSDFKRPLASLSFTINILLSGLDPFAMKLTNLLIHLANGFLVLLLMRRMFAAARAQSLCIHGEADNSDKWNAALIAIGWMLLPINLTGVLYTVQRMESLANLAVLAGLLGYIAGRRRMLEPGTPSPHESRSEKSCYVPGLVICVLSLTLATLIGLLAKETAVMLPLYAFVAECVLFRFRARLSHNSVKRRDKWVIAVFIGGLAVPCMVGMALLLPGLLKPDTWLIRDFTMRTRLLSEARIVLDYIAWTVTPSASALSFYHDDFVISQGLFAPWTTATSLLGLVFLLISAIGLRQRRPMISIGLGWFLSSHLLTATIIPLELVYEHRNYFASLGLLLAVIPLLVPNSRQHKIGMYARLLLLGALFANWGWLTAATALSWGDPLGLPEELAKRAPNSPRAQYELGRAYIIFSGYDRNSPFIPLTYPALERAAALPGSTILPEQALIFLNARLNAPIKDAWWQSMRRKLQSHKPGIQDESSLAALTLCAREKHCDLPKEQMIAAFNAALAHKPPSARLMSIYSDYAWNVLSNRELGLQMATGAAKASPKEAAYWITLARMQIAQRQNAQAQISIEQLRRLDIADSLQSSIRELVDLSEAESISSPVNPQSSASSTNL